MAIDFSLDVLRVHPEVFRSAGDHNTKVSGNVERRIRISFPLGMFS